MSKKPVDPKKPLNLEELLAKAFADGVKSGAAGAGLKSSAAGAATTRAPVSNSSSSSNSAAARSSFDRKDHEGKRASIHVNGKDVLAGLIPNGTLLDALIEALQNRAQSAQSAGHGVIQLGTGSLGPIFDFTTPPDLCILRIDATASIDGDHKLNALVGFQRIEAFIIALRQVRGYFSKPLRPSQIATIDGLLIKLARAYKTKDPKFHAFIVKINADLKAIPATSLSKDL